MMRFRSVLVCLVVLLAWPGIGWGAYGEIQDDNVDIKNCWHLNNNVTDSCGSSNGTNFGATVIDNGYFGQAYSFNGSSNYISVPTKPNEVGTTSFWFKRNGAGSDAMNYILFNYSAGGQRYYFVDTATYYQIRIGGSSFTNVKAIDTNTWHNIIIITSSTTFDVYCDGILVLDDISGANTALAATTYLARADYATGFFNGIIDEVIFFTRSLTPIEAIRFYAMQKGRFQIIGALDQMPYADRMNATPRPVLAWDWACPWGLKFAA